MEIGSICVIKLWKIKHTKAFWTLLLLLRKIIALHLINMVFIISEILHIVTKEMLDSGIIKYVVNLGGFLHLVIIILWEVKFWTLIIGKNGAIQHTMGPFQM